MSAKYDLFVRCKRGDANAQRILYDLFKSKLMGLCRRYTKNREEAQDVLQESFIRIFSRITQVEAPDKLESWMKAIAVRTAITHYHRGKARALVFPENAHANAETPQPVIDNLTDEYLISLVNELPDGCRMVFNLFAVEGYSHKEIAELLHVTEGTSRSQLYHAKLLLKEKLKCHSLAHYYEKFA